MPNTDATETYLAAVYACPVPAPEQQLRWAAGIDRAQRDFNRALAGSPAAVQRMLELCRQLPRQNSGTHVLARWVGRHGTDEPDANALLETCMTALAGVSADDAHCCTDTLCAYLAPLRLRTEFMAEMIAALRGAEGVGAAALETFSDAVQRIRVRTDRLVRANQRLVAVLARQYRNAPLPFMDLIQEGNLGLLRAIERFDPGHGTRVSTYAMWWVRRAMVYAIARQGHAVRPSLAQYWGAREVIRTLDRLERERGRRATLREAAERLGTTVAEVQRRLGILAPPLALDAPVDGAEDVTRIERLMCLSGQDPEHAAVTGDMRRAVGRLLDQLPERHARILRLRFGIGVHEDCTLEQIARQQGVTRERIRQLESQALAALRRLDSAWKVRGCLG